MKNLALSIRYTQRYAGRYIFLFIVMSLGFGLVTVLTGLSDGMRTAVRESAVRHYGGEMFILGASKKGGTFLVIEDVNKVKTVIQASGYSTDVLYYRTNLVGNGFVFFNGRSARQKNILGIDFVNEKDLLARLNLVAGEYPSKSNEIIISDKTAYDLQVNINDSVTLKLPTRTGQINTGEFIVAAIAVDSGIFGAYRAITNRVELNRLLNMNDDAASSVGFLLKAGKNPFDISAALYAEAEKQGLQLSNQILEKNDLTRGMDERWEGIRHFILPLDVYISQVSDLLSAMDLASYVLFLLIAVIIIVSVYVSFNVLLKDRTAELASMRAIGMQRSSLIQLIMGEAGILFCFALAAGSIFAALVFMLTSGVDFSFIPGFELFLQQGKLQPEITALRTVTNVLILLLTIIPAVGIPVRRVAFAPVQQGLQEGME